MTWFTAIVIAAFATLMVASVFLSVLFLWWGLRWAGIEGVSWKRVLLLLLVVFVLELLLFGILLWVDLAIGDQGQRLDILEMVLSIAVECSLIAIVFKVRPLRAVKAWLPTWVLDLGCWGIASFVFTPFVFESFSTPTNAMAPTILGQHWKAKCANCGEPAYCSSNEDFGPYDSEELMICENFHLTKVREFDRQVHTEDRLLVSKFLTAKRWDLVVLSYPGDPSVLYLFRLVGLPGEEVVIRDGFVWIDGERLIPPDDLKGLRYVTEIDGRSSSSGMAGSPDRPAKLGSDEYFVLGDFSPRAKDSRLWFKGAPGHPPYAVPDSYMHGVLTHIYWPPSRWRAFR